MASSDKTAFDYRRTDPDETEGRRLYRALADRQARQDIALTRRVWMKAADVDGQCQVRRPSSAEPPPSLLDNGGRR